MFAAQVSVSIFYFVLHRALARLHLTSQRLGAVAAYTTVYAGYKRSISHCLFRGISAAVAPNRQLCVRHLHITVMLILIFNFVNIVRGCHDRYSLKNFQR